MKKWIEAQTYETLLRCWRFLPSKLVEFTTRVLTRSRNAVSQRYVQCQCKERAS